ncbi:hypothetical protein AQI88_08575 [Streptomyces cellostaticus]|uniref:Uncharacterized protein n=1 Tax=Streptomyces cellostaticus TaxID=67285 RepID=A0A124HDE1_9ACTN|nr:hypothetical protein [Streptomyces cellostaticus]KUM97311.1 hypothetical protein AQI88_08575 [Streptomyces cellostaticus]GHI03883.1 hypothetical protein Scel_22040 [Streptomyces cellostaticus]
MSRRARARRRGGRARGGDRLPAHGATRVPAPRATAGGPPQWSGRGTAGDWVLLPGGTWRRVETIRVRSLFG